MWSISAPISPTICRSTTATSRRSPRRRASCAISGGCRDSIAAICRTSSSGRMILSSLGQDGLVANTLKYLDGQHVIGLNPDPKRWDGVPLPFGVADLAGIVAEEIRGRRPVKSVTMAKATLNTGTELYAVNDLFIGPRSHISAPICFVGRRQGGAPILEWHHRLDGPRLYRLAEKHLCGLARDDREPDDHRDGRRGGGRFRLGCGPSPLCRARALPKPHHRRLARHRTDQPRPPHDDRLRDAGARRDLQRRARSGFLEFNSGTKVTIGLAERHGSLVA